jgi:hypothetical protein
MLKSSNHRSESQSRIAPGPKHASIHFGMNNHDVSVSVNNVVVSGRLMISDDIWAFSSDDAAFLSVFPSGMTYSFSQFTPGDTHQKFWRHTIALKADQLRSVIV